MCQAYEGERAYLVQRDLSNIRKQYEDHKSARRR